MSPGTLHRIPLLAPVLLMVLGACSDDRLSDLSADGRRIMFDVAAESMATAATRTEHTPSVTPLKGGERELYLVARVSEGIDTGTRGPSTRGIPLDSSTIGSFGVYARRADEDADALPDYMRNVEVTRADAWTPAEEYLWPGDASLCFTAYSPYRAAGESEGITSLPSDGAPGAIGYVTPADVASQEDLMYATPAEASASPCALTFNHALTAIRFAAGSELTPCTVKSVTISGAASSGTRDIRTGAWSDLASPSSFSVAPGVSLTAADGSEYVAPGADITSASEAFLLIPQSPGEDAEVTVTVDFDGTETTLTASLGGQTWEAGHTVTYRISANPASDSLTLDVTGTFDSPYTGTALPFEIKSHYTAADGTESPVSWTAEFVDADGNATSTPAWIASMPVQGEGDLSGTIATQLNDIIFLAMSDPTAKLQAAADINSTSGRTPYNLSSSTGDATVENTANTYIISAPGSYSLPLVYGNAIENSAPNTKAYTSTSHNRYALKTFVNHLNQGITDPYIYNNSGCTPAGAELIWEDELNLIRDVALSADGHTLTFDVPHNTIRQGNAIVAVTDADGNVMWSWQLWITDFNPSEGLLTVKGTSTEIRVWPENVGYVSEGDRVRFPEASVRVRFTQTGVPDGMTPLSRTITLTQSGTEIDTPECNTFYQWGRKDPMMSAVKQWYDASHQEITTLPDAYITQTLTDDTLLPQWWIRNPQTMMLAAHDTRYSYTNLWDANLSSTSTVKTVYDPCPAGAKVPQADEYKNLQTAYTMTAGPGRTFLVTPSQGGDTLTFHTLGYRTGSSGRWSGAGTVADIWLCTAMTTRLNAACIVVNSSRFASQTNPPYHAFSIRPMAE